MWENVGGKLQTFAKIICWLGIIGSVILAIALWSQNSRYRSTILLGFVYLIAGGLGSWLSSLAMYGLGLVVEHVECGGSIRRSYSSGNSTDAESSSYLSSGNYWVCPKCKTKNPRSKVECSECGEVRP